METLALAEQHGINTVSMHNPPHPMSRPAPLPQGARRQDPVDHLPHRAGRAGHGEVPRSRSRSWSRTAARPFTSGASTPTRWSAQGKMDLIAKAVELPKEFGVPSGVGAPSLDVVKACEKHGVKADFYIKTFHHHNYPTAPEAGPDQGALQRIPRLLVQQPGGNRRVHEDRQEALDRLQDHGRRRRSRPRTPSATPSATARTSCWPACSTSRSPRTSDSRPRPWPAPKSVSGRGTAEDASRDRLIV